MKEVDLKKLLLELGGKGLTIVFDEADLELAAKSCIDGVLKNAGQRCDAVSAVLVQESISNGFVNKILKHLDSWKVGDPRLDQITIGPLITEQVAEYVEELVRDNIGKGLKLLMGSKLKANYFESTVLDEVALAAMIAWEETFGPVVTIVRIKSEGEAIDIGHKSNYSLDSCVFSTSFYRIWKIAKRLRVWEITINGLTRR